MRAKSPQENSLPWPDERRLDRWLREFRHEATRLGFEVFPQLSRSALAMEAAKLSLTAHSPLFSQDLREISPTLNEDLLDLYGRGEQVIANLFAFHNVSEALEGDFDWDMHESAAWRRELHSFDFGLALAMTYRISQENGYAQHLRYLISHWIARNPPVTSTGWDLGPLARRVRNWILAWDLAGPAWQDSTEFQEIFRQSLAMQCVFLARHATESDSATISLHCARALTLASRIFGKSGAEFAETARSLLGGATNSVLHCDNHAELPRPIELYELAEAILEFAVFPPPAETDSSRTNHDLARRVLAILEGALAPDGTLPMLGQAARAKVDELSDLYALAAVIFQEPRWKNLAGKFGILPYLILGERGKNQFQEMAEEPWDSGPRAIPELGLVRLGAGKRSSLLISSRPNVAEPDHQDFLSYELYLGGLRVVVDSGPYSPEGESWNKFFSSGQAHNVLLVDGQSPRATGTESRPIANDSGRSPSPAGNLPPGMSSNHDGFGFLGIRHHRAFFNLDGDAWAVVDWLQGSSRHQVSSLIHLFPTFEIELRADRALARSRALSVTIFPVGFALAGGSSNPALQTWRGPGTQNQGLYSPDFGVKFPSAVVEVSWNSTELPWIGGYVIARGTEQSFAALEANAVEGRLSFELSGITRRLQIP